MGGTSVQKIDLLDILFVQTASFLSDIPSFIVLSASQIFPRQLAR